MKFAVKNLTYKNIYQQNYSRRFNRKGYTVYDVNNLDKEGNQLINRL